MIATIYTKTVKRRATGRMETRGCVYSTKSLTPMHAHIRQACPGAETWENPTRVITDFIVGMNLGMLPIVSGGRRLA